MVRSRSFVRDRGKVVRERMTVLDAGTKNKQKQTNKQTNKGLNGDDETPTHIVDRPLVGVVYA